MRSKGKLETPAKAKSRIKKFESCLEYNHRLALTYASNQPGDVPKVPTYEGTGGAEENLGQRAQRLIKKSGVLGLGKAMDKETQERRELKEDILSRQHTYNKKAWDR